MHGYCNGSQQHGPAADEDAELRGSVLALRSAIARRVQQLTAEERELGARDRNDHSPTRTAAARPPGVGPHAAAQLVLSWSHQGRITSEAAFARLAGAAPIPASSGQTVRYRLDRSGDRKLDRALHMILVTRKRSHPATIAYIERRLQEGKTRREANRCLKRYLPTATSTGYSNTDHHRQLSKHEDIAGAGLSRSCADVCCARWA